MPVVFAGNLVFGKRLSNLFLLMASLFFYAWGEPRLVVLMIFSIIWNYLAGLMIAFVSRKKLMLFIGVLCRKKKLMDRKGIDALKTVAVQIGLPAVLLHTFATAEYSWATGVSYSH